MAKTSVQKRSSGAPHGTNRPPAALPRVDVCESDHEFILLADLPGVRKGDLAISVHEEKLTLEAYRGEPEPAADAAAEYHPASYRRTFTVPQGIDRDKIEVRGLPLRDALCPFKA